MRITTGELICFNSMLDRTPIWGFHGDIHAEEKSSINSTIESLKEHQFLEEGRPNKKFALAVELLRRYKRAKKYLVVNNYRLALLAGKEYIIVLHQVEEDWELELVNKKEFFTSLIIKNEFLVINHAPESKKTTTVLHKDWVSSIVKKDIGRFIWIQAIKKGKANSPIIMYELDGMSFMYDSNKENLVEADVASMQIMLAQLFEIPLMKGAGDIGKNA